MRAPAWCHFFVGLSCEPRWNTAHPTYLWGIVCSPRRCFNSFYRHIVKELRILVLPRPYSGVLCRKLQNGFAPACLACIAGILFIAGILACFAVSRASCLPSGFGLIARGHSRHIVQAVRGSASVMSVAFFCRRKLASVRRNHLLRCAHSVWQNLSCLSHVPTGLRLW